MDEKKNKSSVSKRFKQKIISDTHNPLHVYRRWEEDTYYMALDYVAVTVTPNNNNRYNIMYMNHVQQYIWFVLLNFYYRDSLTDIMGRYADLGDIKDRRNEEEANELLEDYYELNQKYIFDRITNAPMGMDLWNLYEGAFRSKRLYEAVKSDMNALNLRLSNLVSNKQNQSTLILTLVAGLTGMMGMNVIIQGTSVTSIFEVIAIPTIILVSFLALKNIKNLFNVFFEFELSNHKLLDLTLKVFLFILILISAIALFKGGINKVADSTLPIIELLL
jgi:hypothetical protein